MTLLKLMISLSFMFNGDVLTNQSVKELVEKGLSENLIVAIIANTETNFNTSVDAILKLREEGVPDKVLEAMLDATGKKGYDPSADDQLLVYVTDSQSWSMTGGFTFGTQGGGGYSTGGARPQTAEIIKTFGERCPELTVTNDRTKADYIVLLDHEGGKGIIRKDNKVAVFEYTGMNLYSGSTRSLGNAVKDACKAIRKNRNP